jgi:hypothetical protein
MPNLRPLTATAQPLTPFSGVKMRNFLASGQINGQFSLIEGIMVSGAAANRSQSYIRNAEAAFRNNSVTEFLTVRAGPVESASSAHDVQLPAT